uniref:SLAM family member 5-like n=1 Tax=Salmo trutta TaxID=8032 RepID=A0A674CS82_SALTR
MSLLLGFGLLTCIASSESSSVFVLKGQDVRLDVQENVTLKELELFKWTFRSENILRCTDTLSVRVSPEYNNRLEFYQGNFSLLLKNLQQNDSGPYTAVLNGDKEKTIIAYQLIVQERVEPPVLTVDSNSSINATCNVTVTCRGQNTSVTSSCNSRICSQVGGESRGAETSTVRLLSVYVAGGFIICNHSNQVSWANDTKEIVELCPMKSVIRQILPSRANHRSNQGEATHPGAHQTDLPPSQIRELDQRPISHRSKLPTARPPSIQDPLTVPESCPTTLR